METLSPSDLVAHALVLYVDDNQQTDIMDQIERYDRESVELEEDDAAGILDHLTAPEGMNLMESSMGEIPDV